MPAGGYVGDARRPEQGARYVALNEQFGDVASYRTVGLENTDLHDFVLLPDGNRILIAYEPNAKTGLVDAMIQEVDAAGEVVFEWSSAASRPPTSRWSPDADYAHINSVAGHGRR